MKDIYEYAAGVIFFNNKIKKQMIEKDYIRRLILVFLSKLTELLSKENYKQEDILSIKDIYQSAFAHDKDYFIQKDIKEILEEIDKDCYFERLKLLGLIFEFEGKMSTNRNDRILFLEKSLFLLTYLSKNNGIYDLEIEHKIRNLQNEIEQS